MKLVFMGTPVLAVKVLEALVKDGHDIAGVYTSPDRIVGRGRNLQYSPVKSYSIKERLPVYQPHSINSWEDYNELKSISPEAKIGKRDLDVVVINSTLLESPNTAAATARQISTSNPTHSPLSLKLENPIRFSAESPFFIIAFL